MLLAVHYLILFVAALRLTRLATTDVIAEKLVIKHLRASKRAVPKFLVELFDCPYCIGFWVSAGLLVADYWLADVAVWRVALAALALAYVVGHVSDKLDK